VGFALAEEAANVEPARPRRPPLGVAAGKSMRVLQHMREQRQKQRQVSNSELQRIIAYIVEAGKAPESRANSKLGRALRALLSGVRDKGAASSQQSSRPHSLFAQLPKPQAPFASLRRRRSTLQEKWRKEDEQKALLFSALTAMTSMGEELAPLALESATPSVSAPEQPRPASITPNPFQRGISAKLAADDPDSPMSTERLLPTDVLLLDAGVKADADSDALDGVVSDLRLHQLGAPLRHSARGGRLKRLVLQQRESHGAPAAAPAARSQLADIVSKLEMVNGNKMFQVSGGVAKAPATLQSRSTLQWADVLSQTRGGASSLKSCAGSAINLRAPSQSGASREISFAGSAVAPSCAGSVAANVAGRAFCGASDAMDDLRRVTEAVEAMTLELLSLQRQQGEMCLELADMSALAATSTTRPECSHVGASPLQPLPALRASEMSLHGRCSPGSGRDGDGDVDAASTPMWPSAKALLASGSGARVASLRGSRASTGSISCADGVWDESGSLGVHLCAAPEEEAGAKNTLRTIWSSRLLNPHGNVQEEEGVEPQAGRRRRQVGTTDGEVDTLPELPTAQATPGATGAQPGGSSPQWNDASPEASFGIDTSTTWAASRSMPALRQQAMHSLAEVNQPRHTSIGLPELPSHYVYSGVDRSATEPVAALGPARPRPRRTRNRAHPAPQLGLDSRAYHGAHGTPATAAPAQPSSRAPRLGLIQAWLTMRRSPGRGDAAEAALRTAVVAVAPRAPARPLQQGWLLGPPPSEALTIPVPARLPAATHGDGPSWATRRQEQRRHASTTRAQALSPLASSQPGRPRRRTKAPPPEWRA